MGTLDLFCKTISGEKNLIKIDIWGWCEFISKHIGAADNLH